MTLSIGARLTSWYVGVLTIAVVSVAAASWWLSTQSVLRATDAGLQARVDGVRAFLENPRTSLTIADLRAEFGEYAELTRGEALLDVVDIAAGILARPAIPGWAALVEAQPLDPPAAVRPLDRVLAGLPFRVASAELVANDRTYRVTVAAPMQHAYEGLRQFHTLLFGLLPVAIAIAGAGGYWISRRALAPVDEVTRAVQAITVDHLDRRLELPHADDELRRLTSTFNDVLARLEAAVADIVRFTADASHELRTPVSIITTTAELALRRDRQPEEYRQALGEIVAHGRHMSQLVSDLLVLARTDAGIESRPSTRVDIVGVAAEAVRESDAVATAHAVRIRSTLPDEPCEIAGDDVTLKRLLLILLENAVRYSRPGGEVRLVVRCTRGDAAARVVIEVCDDGIGIDPSERARVFERFYRGSRARQHAPDGTGLGLAILQRIVEGYGGSVSLDSKGGPADTGCSATVSLPR